MKVKGVPIAFFDFALNLVCILIAIMVISTIEPPKKQDASVTPKAEFIVELSWSDNSPDDLDVYLRQPDGQIVYFSNRQTAAAFLDTDNIGRGNTITQPDGTTVQVPARVEIITIRAIMPGTFTANCHLYRKNSDAGYVNHAKLRVIKVNPYSVITEASADFDQEGQERTLANFVVEPDGHVSSVFVSEVKLVGAAK